GFAMVIRHDSRRGDLCGRAVVGGCGAGRPVATAARMQGRSLWSPCCLTTRRRWPGRDSGADVGATLLVAPVARLAGDDRIGKSRVILGRLSVWPAKGRPQGSPLLVAMS